MAKMFVHYSKTKAEFISAGLATTYNDSIVFIKGDANGNGSCIYTHGQYFANFSEFLAAINYVKGITVGGQSYNAAAGGGYVAFEASDPSTVAVNTSQSGVSIGLTEAFVNKVNNTATNLGSTSDTANASGSAFARIANLAALVSDLTGGSTESIAGQIEALRTEILGTLGTDDAKTLAAINDELDTLASQYTTIDNVLEEIRINDKSIYDSTDGAKEITLTGDDIAWSSTSSDTLSSVIGSLSATVVDNANAAKVTVTPSTNDNYAQVYTIAQGSTTIGTINIPKDKVVESGEIVVNPSGQAAGTYIKLVLQNVATPLYINVGDLVDVYTAQASAAQVQVAISENNVISATIVAGSIGSTELATDAVVTAKIKDANVTKAKLESSVQTSLGKADTAYQKPSTGIAKSDLASAVQTSLGKADSAYQKPSAGIPATDLASAVQTSLGKADAAAPQATTYTKAEVDAMWEWEEL